ncbi:MAG TPA: PAS domain S-box protein [Spirochaetota bacterium]|nr:PAS domain S-box protein [Spirochaetota bacterium]HPJ36188.1 PAS domain S-box protein [Spirochaetota bacterium]
MINILVVEDDKPSGLILKKLLIKSGYNVLDTVSTGEEALNVIKKQKTDLVLMDITLPGAIDGVETAERIYKENNIPFIYITAGTDGPTFERAKKSLPLNYIVKPFNSQSLSSSIEIALFKFDMEKKLKESESHKKKIIESLPDIIFSIKRDGSPYSEQDVKIMKKVWPGDIASQATPAIEEAFKTDSAKKYEFGLDTDSGKKFYESIIISLGADSALISTRDITELKKHEADIEDQMVQLEKAINDRTGELQKLNKSLIYEIDKRSMVEEEIKLFVDVTEQSPRSLIIFERTGIVKYVNKAFSNISGYSKEELTGLSVTETPNPIIPEDSMIKQFRGNETWTGEIYNTNKKGELYYLNVTVSKIRNKEGKTTNFVVTGDDITERKRDELELDRMKQSLRGTAADTIDKEMDWQSWKEKMLERNISRTDKSIFSNINNSFTQGAGFGTLITFMEMMSKSSNVEDDKRIVEESLFQEAMKNVKIAQDAFKIFAGIDWIISNTFELELKTVKDLYTILKGVISKNSKFAPINKNRIIINELPRGMKNKKLRINSQYLAEAVSELIINALKFSRNDTNVLVMLYSQNSNVRLSVINEPMKTGDGITGIPPEFEKVIFEPFYRISKLVFEKYNTLDFGIGLTFVEKVISRHGGEIFAENILDYSDIKKDPVTKVNLMISFPIARD